MKLHTIYLIATILFHISVYYLNIFSRDIYSIDWKGGFDEHKVFNFFTSFLVGGTFISNLEKHGINSNLKADDIGYYFMLVLFYSGFIQLRNLYYSMKTLENSGKSQEQGKKNLLYTVGVVSLLICAYGLLGPMLMKNKLFYSFINGIANFIGKLGFDSQLVKVMQQPVLNYIPFHMALYTICCNMIPLHENDLVAFKVQDQYLPYLLLAIYFIMGLLFNIGSFYDYTMYHMVMGTLVGKGFSHFAQDRKFIKIQA